MLRILILILSVTILSCSKGKEEITNHEKQFFEIPDNSIINLYDAFGNNDDLNKDFGFSCIVKYKGVTILFDAGTNADIFKKNVEALNIDLSQIDFAIASHAHFDHINGFDYLLEINPDIKIYFPSDLFWGANFPFNIAGQDTSIIDSLDLNMQYFGGDFHSFTFNQSGRFWKADIEYVKNNREIMPGIKLIATTSPYMGYFSKYPSLNPEIDMASDKTNSEQQTNFIQLPELSLSINTPEGEILIVGCSHSTVEKIVAETKSLTKNQVKMVFGGYHLLPYDRETLTNFSRRLKNELNVSQVAPAHCTGHLAFKILQDFYQESYIYAGLGEIVRF